MIATADAAQFASLVFAYLERHGLEADHPERWLATSLTWLVDPTAEAGKVADAPARSAICR
jgi:hypothetical protein